MSDLELDDFFEPSNVMRLTKKTYQKFLKNRDRVLVMFYATCKESSYDIAPQFGEAADKNTVPNSAYASISCVGQEMDLCYRENVVAPMFKLYAKGKLVGTVSNPEDYSSCMINDYMKNSGAPPAQ